MAAMMVQASSGISFGGQKKVASPSLGVPMQQPLGSSRPQTAAFAFSGAMVTGNNFLKAVRRLPSKLEKVDSEDVFGSFLGKREKADAARPVFRSALEQVSYETNNSLASDKASGRPGIGQKLANLLKK